MESRLKKKRLFNICNDIDEVTSIYVIIGGHEYTFIRASNGKWFLTSFDYNFYFSLHVN